MKFSDNFFDKIEKKTNVNKDTILSIASKVQKQDIKDEKILRELIGEISSVAGKSVTKEKEDSIVKAVLKDDVPSNFDDII